MVPFEHSVDYK